MALSTRGERSDSVLAKRRDTQNNPKEISEISNTNGYDAAAEGNVFLRPDESYRTGYTEVNGVGDTGMARILEEKEESYAAIRLIRKANIDLTKNYKQFQEETNIIPPYTRFFLQQTSHADQEKYQIIESFGDFKVFFFDRQPLIKNYSGYLLNTKNNGWLSDFDYVYDNYLRGTKSVQLDALTYLTFDNVVVEGYIINAQISQSSLDNTGVPFTFSMIITDRSPLNLNDVLQRNRVTKTFRSDAQVIENQRRLPNAALSAMRKFFSEKKTVTVKPAN